jgi:FdhD protein
VRRWRGDRSESCDDAIAEEVPVAFLYNEQPHAVMMATPRDLDDFAVGFSLGEAIVTASTEIGGVEVRTRLEGIELAIRVPANRADALEKRRRALTGRTGCGLCGAQSLEDAVRQPPPVADGPCIGAATLRSAIRAVGAAQSLNRVTGATHAAAWAGRDGTITLVREDVGRHNALDKLIGALARTGTDTRAGFAVVTSRASFEMVQKAATAGITLLAAMSAPTVLAIHLAEATGLTLIAFARRDGHVVYSHPWRMIDEPAGTRQ